LIIINETFLDYNDKSRTNTIEHLEKDSLNSILSQSLINEQNEEEENGVAKISE
jgi:hypothetical protein